MATVAEHSFTTPKCKKVKKHSLKPQIFLQLELSSPQAKSIDPSQVGVLNSGWRNDPSKSMENSSDHFITHVRVEHCGGLPAEKEIRYEGPGDVLAFPDLLDISASSERGESKDDYEDLSELKPDTTIKGSPTSVKCLGRHDHLLEPLAGELFQELENKNHQCKDQEEKSSADPPKSSSSRLVIRRSNSGDEQVDVSGSSLDLFAMVDIDLEKDETKEEQINKPRPRRRGSRRSQLLRSQSLTVLEEPKPNEKKDAPQTPRRRRRTSVGAESRSRSKSNSRNNDNNSPLSRSNHRERKPNRTKSDDGKVDGASAPGTPRRRRSDAVSCKEMTTERLSKGEEFRAPPVTTDKVSPRPRGDSPSKRSSHHHHPASTSRSAPPKDRALSSSERRSRIEEIQVTRSRTSPHVSRRK